MTSIIKTHADRESNTPGHDEAVPPQESGEQSISGHMPDLDTDDNVLREAHAAGLYTEDESGDDPQEINLAQEVAEAEAARRQPPSETSN